VKEQKWPDNLIIVRHGESRRNVDREAAKAAGAHPDFSQGVRDQDTPLTPLGEMQSLSVGVELRKRFPGQQQWMLNEKLGDSKLWTPLPDDQRKRIDVLYYSPYLRTRQTADKLIEGLGYKPEHFIHDERIREIEFGLLDGLDRRGIEVKYPEEILRRAKEGKYWYRAPGGESRPDVKIRLRSFIDTLVRDCRGLNVVIVCHSVVVLSFRALLEKWGEDDYLQVDRENDVKNASITHYAYNSPTGQGHKKLVLEEFNSIFYAEPTQVKGEESGIQP
jgi:broad specificity phosphatase PhoE